MHITIEQNKVIVNLDENEFPAFEAMFRNLELDKFVQCDFRDFDFGDYGSKRKLLPMHLCRTIGEANLGSDPFATVSLYPFWKHGFAFGADDNLIIAPGVEDPHKKAVAADEFGMGFCCWAMEELFNCDTWADCSALIKMGAVFPVGTKRPDFVCTLPDGSLGVFEAKGTTGTAGNLALSQGKIQTQGITADDPISLRVVVGCALGGDTTRIVLLDPPPSTPLGDRPSNGERDERSLSGAETNGVKTNLTADLVKRAAKGMRTQTQTLQTVFRSPTAELNLKRKDYKDDKGHGWLEINR